LIADSRDELVIATKATYPTSKDPNGGGSSRYHLVRAVEASSAKARLQPSSSATASNVLVRMGGTPAWGNCDDSALIAHDCSRRVVYGAPSPM